MKTQGRTFYIPIIVAYAHASDCNKEEVDMFYDNLDMAKAQCKSQEITTVMRDLKSKVGCEGGSDMVGKHGLRMQNDCGE